MSEVTLQPDAIRGCLKKHFKFDDFKSKLQRDAIYEIARRNYQLFSHFAAETDSNLRRKT